MKKLVVIVGFLFIFKISMAQNMGIGTNTPDASAQLDISSTTKGFLPPRMTTAQRDAIVNPANGLIIFNTAIQGIEIKTGTGWISLSSSSADAMPTIQIGIQKWASENLDVAFYRNGNPIPQVTDSVAWAALTTGAWCYYINDSTQGNKYGKLYNWYAVTDPRGLAPQGWHIPTDAEWLSLESRLGGFAVAGGKLKQAGTLNWRSPNIGGNGISGFEALPGGNRELLGESLYVGEYGFWWSSSQFNTTQGWGRSLLYNDGKSNAVAKPKYFGYSVRCLRD